MTQAASLSQQIEGLAAEFNGTLGVMARDLQSGEEVRYHEAESFPTASMIKILVLFELFRQVNRGAAQLFERVTLRPVDKTLGSGLLFDLDDGLNLTLRDVAVLMMAISDNTATNMLIDRLGIYAINQAIRETGMHRTELRNRIDFDLIGKSNDNLAVGTPEDFCNFLTALQRRELLPGASTDDMLAIMRIQKHTGFPLGRQLPVNPYAESFGEKATARIASKTGGLKGVRCESGIVEHDGGAYAISVMVKDCPDNRWSPDNEGMRVIARVSRAVWDAWGSSAGA